MIEHVDFIRLDEDDKDIIIAFAISDKDLGIRSLILHRTLFFEEYLDEEEKGVIVALEDDHFSNEQTNTLTNISINNNTVKIFTPYREYSLDISGIDKDEISSMLNLLKKQNHDSRFTIQNV